MNSDLEPTEQKRVEQLSNFPFASFQELEAAYSAKTAWFWMNAPAAINWACGAQYSSNWLNIQCWALIVLPWVTFAAFAAYCLVREPWLLLALPLLVVGYIVLNPAMTVAFGCLPLALVCVLCVAAWATNRIGLLAVTVALLVSWASQKTLQTKAGHGLSEALAKDEDLLCSSWGAGLVGIIFSNGDTYWVDRKRIGGEYVTHLRSEPSADLPR